VALAECHTPLSRANIRKAGPLCIEKSILRAKRALQATIAGDNLTNVMNITRIF